MKIFFRSSAVDENSPDVRNVQDGGQIVGGGIFDLLIGTSLNLAAGNDIPKSDAILEQERSFFIDRPGNVLFEHTRHHAPKAILRIFVIKLRFPRLHRRKTAENQHFAVAVINRRQALKDGAHRSINLSA